MPDCGGGGGGGSGGGGGGGGGQGKNIISPITFGDIINRICVYPRYVRHGKHYVTRAIVWATTVKSQKYCNNIGFINMTSVLYLTYILIGQW